MIEILKKLKNILLNQYLSNYFSFFKSDLKKSSEKLVSGVLRGVSSIKDWVCFNFCFSNKILIFVQLEKRFLQLKQL